MGFNKVYKALQEIFPEVDSRLLRAVAIEHQKDVNSAVEVVLTEVIPYLTEKSSLAGSSSENRTAEQTPISSSESRTGVPSPEGEGASGSSCIEDAHLQTEEQHGQFYDAESDHDQLFHDANGRLHQICGDSSIGKLTSIKNYDETAMTVCDNVSSTIPHGNEANTYHKICGDHPKSEDAITCGNYQESIEIVSNQQTQITSSALEHENSAVDQSINSSLHVESINGENYQETITSGNYQESIEVVSNQQTQIPSSALEHETSAVDQSINSSLHVESINGENYQENNGADGEVVGVENSLDHIVRSSFGASILSSAECGTKSVDMPDVLNSDAMKETNDSESDASKIGSPNELADVMDESTLTTGVTPSAQICSVDLLEDIIADARNNKKTLFSAMECVISLMRDVELQEKAAEQAKEEAAEGGLEIFKRVEELKQMLQHAKEANDMHAGEVYGEKAILATEVRELQSRLLSLSDERDKSLGILDEMRRSLEVRSAAAEKEIEAAEKAKLEKIEIGRKLLADQEKIMDKVVQEANILKQEAEENAKLQEFLVDRGRLIDILQGEISVICQDVRLLKEKFDERLPLSESLTSSQTSCILASSSSSLKSMAPEQVDQMIDQTDPSETAEKTDLMSSFAEPESFGAENATEGHKALIEDGWEIFDNHDSYR